MNDIICEESFDVVLGQGKHGTRVQPFRFCKHRSRTSAVGCFLRQTPWPAEEKNTGRPYVETTTCRVFLDTTIMLSHRACGDD